MSDFEIWLMRPRFAIPCMSQSGSSLPPLWPTRQASGVTTSANQLRPASRSLASQRGHITRDPAIDEARRLFETLYIVTN